jgi:hypothetical protein
LIAPFNGVLIYSFAAMFNFTEGPVFVKGRDDQGNRTSKQGEQFGEIGFVPTRPFDFSAQ